MRFETTLYTVFVPFGAALALSLANCSTEIDFGKRSEEAGGAGGAGGAADQGSTPFCGDGIVQEPERCDDGNLEGYDGCSPICNPEPLPCGDGVLDPGESCDDGDYLPHDGCGFFCEVEDGWECPTPGQPCTRIVCGDGIVASGEACDDGNLISNDGCDGTCLIEAGYTCFPSGVCVPAELPSDDASGGQGNAGAGGAG